MSSLSNSSEHLNFSTYLTRLPSYQSGPNVGPERSSQMGKLNHSVSKGTPVSHSSGQVADFSTSFDHTSISSDIFPSAVLGNSVDTLAHRKFSLHTSPSSMIDRGLRNLVNSGLRHSIGQLPIQKESMVDVPNPFPVNSAGVPNLNFPILSMLDTQQQKRESLAFRRYSSEGNPSESSGSVSQSRVSVHSSSSFSSSDLITSEDESVATHSGREMNSLNGHGKGPMLKRKPPLPLAPVTSKRRKDGKHDQFIIKQYLDIAELVQFVQSQSNLEKFTLLFEDSIVAKQHANTTLSVLAPLLPCTNISDFRVDCGKQPESVNIKAGLKTLATHLQDSKITLLCFSGCTIEADGMKALADVLSQNHLSELIFSKCIMDVPTIEHLGSALASGQSSSLSLENMQLEDKEIIAFAPFLPKSSLKNLSLAYLNISLDAMKTFTNAIMNAQLTKLVVSNSELNPDKIELIVEAVKKTKIRILNLSENNLKDEDLDPFSSLKDFEDLERLILEENEITKEGALQLIESLKSANIRIFLAGNQTRGIGNLFSAKVVEKLGFHPDRKEEIMEKVGIKFLEKLGVFFS